MTDSADAARAKQPKNVLAGPYGHPFHPILVTVPIGAWTAALIFGVVSRFSDDPAVFATGGKWLVAIGIIGALIAAVFGLLDFLQIPGGTPARRVGITHMTLNLTVVVLFAITWLVWPQDGQVGALPLGISVVALLLLGASGWLGGQMSYRYGIRVVDEETQREGFRTRS